MRDRTDSNDAEGPSHHSRVCALLTGARLAMTLVALFPPLLSAQDHLAWRSSVAAHVGDEARCAAVGATQLAMSWGSIHTALTAGASSSPPSNLTLGTSVFAAEIAVPVRDTWTLRGSAAAGRPGASCLDYARWSRGWIQVARRVGPFEGAISYGAPSLAPTDPTRDREGLTVGMQRFGRRVEWGLDVRTYIRRAGDEAAPGTTAIAPGTDTIGGGARPENGSAGRALSAAARSGASHVVDTRAYWQWTRRRLAIAVTGGGTFAPNRSDSASHVPTDTGRAGGSSGSNRPGVRVEFWGRADARWRLSPAATMTLGLAALPAISVADRGVRRLVSLGIEISSWRIAPTARHGGSKGRNERDAEATKFEILAARSVDTSEFLVRVHAARARMVDVAGEHTGWSPIALHARGDGWWEGIVRARPGAYRMSIRIDGGAWVAPPGLPPVRDEFGAQSAVVLIPS